MTKYGSKLQDKRVLVVGGTSGIGFCVAEAAAEFGAIVVIASSSQTKIDSAIKRIAESTPNARITGQACNLSKPETTEDEVKRLVAFTTKDGKLDHVVNTAGDAFDVGSLQEATGEKLFAGQQIRLVGSALLAKHVWPHMNKSNTSSITFTGGINMHKPGPGWALRAAAGSGINGLTLGLAVDMKPIRVNQVVPGAVVTELWSGLFGNDIEKFKAMYAEKMLTGELGRPEDVAEAYLYLMRDNFADGQTIFSEGGYLLM